MRFRPHLAYTMFGKNSSVRHVLIAVVIFAIPLSLIFKVSGAGWFSIAPLPEDRTVVARPLAPYSSTKAIKPARSSMRMTLDFDEDEYSQDPISRDFHQEDQRVLLRVLIGQTFAPAALMISQRLTINNPVNVDEDTYLHLACRTQDPFMVWLLIEAGASRTTENRFGETPMDVIGHRDTEGHARITEMINDQRHSVSIQSQDIDMLVHCQSSNKGAGTNS